MPQYFFEFQIFGNSDDMEGVPIISATCTAENVTDAAEKIMAYLKSIGEGQDCTIEKNEDVIDISFMQSGLNVRLLGVKETTPEEVYAHLDIVKKALPEPEKDYVPVCNCDEMSETENSWGCPVHRSMRMNHTTGKIEQDPEN